MSTIADKFLLIYDLVMHERVKKKWDFGTLEVQVQVQEFYKIETVDLMMRMLTKLQQAEIESEREGKKTDIATNW